MLLLISPLSIQNPETSRNLMAKRAYNSLFLFSFLSFLAYSSGAMVDGSRLSATSSPFRARAISFPRKNNIHHCQMWFLVADHKIIESLHDGKIPEYVYVLFPLAHSLPLSEVSFISWFTTPAVSSSSNSKLTTEHLPLLLPTSLKICPSIRYFNLNQTVKVAVAFPVSILQNLNRKHMEELHQIVKSPQKCISLDPGAKSAATVSPYSGVPMVMNVKIPLVPSSIQVAEFTKKMRRWIKVHSKHMERVSLSSADVQLVKDLERPMLILQQRKIFHLSHRKLLGFTNGPFSATKISRRDSIDPPTTNFPVTLVTTPASIPYTNPTPTSVTMPSTNPVIVTPTNPTTTPVMLPPNTQPLVNPVNPPFAQPITTPIANPVTSFPSPPPGIDPVNAPGIDPVNPPFTLPTTTPITNPVTTFPFPPPGIDPINTPGIDPVNPPFTVPTSTPMTTFPISPTGIDPVNTPGINPAAPTVNPITNPATTLPFPPGTNTVNTPITNPTQSPVTSDSPISSVQTWCVARADASESALQAALDYVCGIGGADCSGIQENGNCYIPNTLQNHASYAFNRYYQRNPVPPNCDFGGTAELVNNNPSAESCIYESSSSTTTATSSNSSSSVLNTTIFGYEVPPGSSTSVSISTNLKPMLPFIILAASFVTGKLIAHL